MIEFKLRLANINITANVTYESTVRYAEDYLADFSNPDFAVTVEACDIVAEREKAKAQDEHDGITAEYSDAYLETLALYRKIAEKMIDYDVILFHASAISLDGECYLFTAKSGTGKSTHTRLWREAFGERAVMVNDDKPLLAISDEGVTAFGTPWNGKHRLGSNISSPLKAICILERAESNSIEKTIGASEFPKIYSQTYRAHNPLFMQKTLALIDKLLQKVPVYKLCCNMEKDAPIVSYNGMKGNDNEA